MTAIDPKTIAIVGGGPAGSVAASVLASAGRKVLLFDEKLAWEKPCGGGVTHKALATWPFLRAANITRNWVRECELISPSGRRVSFDVQQPIAIFSRRVLNGLLLDRAGAAGAEIICDRIIQMDQAGKGWRIRSPGSTWDADYVVIAAGARNSFRKQLAKVFAPEDLMVTAGYFIPGRSELMQIQFLPNLHGYIWVFPRDDHFSAGICGKMRGKTTVELRRILEHWLRSFGLEYEGAQFYSHVLPSLKAESLTEVAVEGDGWAMLGDAAGFVDPITGEGLYYAMRSADLFSGALLADGPGAYRQKLEQDFLPELELAAKMADRFYSGRWMGESVLERTIQFTAGSASFRTLMSDMFAGTQGYRDLRWRLYRTLPRMLAESLSTALSLPTREDESDAIAQLSDVRR